MTASIEVRRAFRRRNLIALGSFAHYLVNHAPCPVLVLRRPDAAE